MSEFRHYDGCRNKDPDNCGACALTTIVDVDGKPGINYTAWPLSYIKNNRVIPRAFRAFLSEEFLSDNTAYVNNLKKQIADKGILIEGIGRVTSWMLVK